MAQIAENTATILATAVQSAGIARNESRAQSTPVLTLLDLVAAVAEAAESEAEVVATVQHLLDTGKVSLVGHFVAADLRHD